jgi:hypothetical protein
LLVIFFHLYITRKVTRGFNKLGGRAGMDPELIGDGEFAGRHVNETD